MVYDSTVIMAIPRMRVSGPGGLTPDVVLQVVLPSSRFLRGVFTVVIDSAVVP